MKSIAISPPGAQADDGNIESADGSATMLADRGEELCPKTQIRVVSWNVGHRITRKAIPPEIGEARWSKLAD